ncbi:MAG TPA: ABC transporter ATP-binding protein [Gaiellaceae bacterium]|jgi:ATP-binding cassette subfamily B protein|nr:ABC transporter ATP-binding protein [Gaiellaceae bacterium]
MPGGRSGGFTPREKVERPSDKAVRQANLRRAGRLFRPYWAKLGVVTLLILVASALGVIPAFLQREIFSKGFVPVVTGTHKYVVVDFRLIVELVIALVAISLASGVCGVLQSYLSTQVGQSVMHDLRTSVYRHLQRLSLAFFTKTRTGEVQSRISNDIGGVDNVLTSTATSVMSTVTTVIATVIAMFLIQWELAIVALGLMPIFVLITRRVGSARRKIATVRQESMADISSLVQESLSVSGILLGKTMGRSTELAQRFEGESSRLADLEVRSRMTGRWMMQSIQITFAVMPSAIYFFGGLEVHQHHGPSPYSTIGTLVAFTTLQTRLFAPIGSLLSISVDIQSSLALFDRIFEYLDLPIDIAPGTTTLEHVRGEVRLDDVWFRYADGPYALSGLDVTIPPGTTTAVVGETGAGKTTVGYLVSRLYDVSKGSVTIDGVDIRDLTFESLAATVGVVSQETYLFHATVRDNLRFAKPDASDEEVEEASRAAQIHGLISSLPEGYDTVVGERGYRFSGGEKQRMAIARAILRNPPILVLDEATSALDNQTERLVQAALARLVEGRTTIAIAHRLSTVREADQIVVLDRGTIVEAGTYDELVAAGGRFAALAARDAESFDSPELAELA